MIALPTLAPMALEKTYQHFQDVLSFDNTEKWITGEIGLFLSSLNVLDLDSLNTSINTLNRAGINETYLQGLTQWAKQLSQFSDNTDNTLELSLGIETDYSDKDRQQLRLKVEANSFAYDIKPLEVMSENDRKVVVRCVAEIRAIFLYCPNVTDMAEFAGYRLEIFETLDELLPADIKKAGLEAMQKYIEDNQSEFDSYDFYQEDDEALLDYIDYLKPMPKWVSDLDKGIGGKNPFKALDDLKRLQGKSKHPDVNALLTDTICSITEFLKSFEDLKSWSDFDAASNAIANGIETDNPSVDFGYMLAWGTEGFWWSTQCDIFESMMHAGEQPTFNAWAYGEHATTAKLCADQIYRGAALLSQMASLTTKIEQNLRDPQSMDNGS